MTWLSEEIYRIHTKKEKEKKNRRFWMVAGALVICLFFIGALSLFFYAQERTTVVIRVEGTLVTGYFPGGEYVGSEYVGEQLRNAADDPLVEAIVLRVNSGGGTPSAAQEIIRDIEYAKVKKPIVVSMGDMATSAAYQISAHADVIYANPDTVTGSIGTIWTFYDISTYLEEEGIDVDVVKSGNKKDMTSTYRSLTPEERMYAQQLVNDSYEDLISDIIQERGIARETVEDARIIRGEEAMELGLVDKMGNLYDAIAEARSLA